MSDDKSIAYASAELGTELRKDNPTGGTRSFAGLVEDRRALDLLNYYDSLLDEPIEETPLGKEIIRTSATRRVDEAIRAGNVSQMKNASGLTGQSEDGHHLLSEAAEMLSHEGSIGLVFGSPGSGKTATTIDVARVWQAMTGGTLIGNTEWDGFERVVTSDEEMLEAMGSIQGPVLALLDEIAQDLSGFGSGNKAAEQFSNSLLWVRKQEENHGRYPKKGSVLATAHTRTKTAKKIREVASFGIEKPSQQNQDRARILRSEGGKDSWEEGKTYQGLTDTAASYSEYDPSEFSIILDEDEDDQDDLDAEEVQKDEHRRTVILAVEKRGMNYDEAAEMVPWSSDWVGKVYRAWRDENAYSELVDIDSNQATE